MALPVDWQDRIRDGIEAYNRGDYSRVVALATDDVELQRAGTSPESRDVVRGRDALLEFFRPDAFTDQRNELLGIEAGDRVVVATLRFRARGTSSGLPVEIDSWIVFRIEGESFTRLEIYADEDEARAAAGLPRD
jgi:ketosteroid isomerase-like protein